MDDRLLSLLEKISSAQVDDLIHEHKLANKGFQFIYSLDNDDLLNYCFPLGLYGQQAVNLVSINYDLITDIITAYEEFFKLISKDQVVFFLPEYLGELYALKERIVAHLVSGGVFDHAPTFRRFMEQELQKQGGSPTNDFTLFIAVATGYIRDGIQRFNKLLETPFFVFNLETLEGLEDHKLYSALFSESEPSSNEKLVSRIVDNFKRNRRRSYFSNRIDSEAIVRVLNINQKLINENQYRSTKKLMLFLSSTDSSIDFFTDNKEIFPRIDGQTFNFHRTVEQLFINRLLRDLPFRAKLERLEKASQLIKFREENLGSLDIKDDESYVILKNIVISNFHEKREDYVNINLARKKQFEDIVLLYQQSVAVNESRSLGSLKRFYNRLKTLSNKVGGSDNLALIKSLENALQIEQIFAIVFKKAISRLLGGNSLILSRGGDTIQSTGHHLPIVFKTEGPGSAKIFDDIAELFLSQVAFYNSFQNKQQELEAIVRLRELTRSITASSLSTKSVIEKMVYCLYLLILPEAQLAQGKTNSIYVEEFLLNLKDEVEKEYDRTDVHADYLYILTWILRRNVKYPQAMDYTNLAINLFPDDARFYHSKFLVAICQTPESDNKKLLHDYFNLYLSDIHRAQELYPKLLEVKNEFIKNNIQAALWNSEIYTNTLIISVAEKMDPAVLAIFLYDLRHTKLVALKELLGDTYTEYPEFLHTEAFLEYYETDTEKDLNNKLNKLDCARDALIIGRDKAKALPGFKTHNFDELLQKIADKKTMVENT